jgi:hypothetical protein
MKGKSLTLIGAAITLALSSNFAMAQSSKSPLAESSESSVSAPTEIKMSLEGMKILCERFPLNSRCPNGIPLDKGFGAMTPVQSPTTNSVENNTNSDATTVPVAPTSPSPENSTQLTPVPDSSASPDANQMNNMDQGGSLNREVPATTVQPTPVPGT